jgi:hypothetical protein
MNPKPTLLTEENLKACRKEAIRRKRPVCADTGEFLWYLDGILYRLTWLNHGVIGHGDNAWIWYREDNPSSVSPQYPTLEDCKNGLLESLKNH